MAQYEAVVASLLPNGRAEIVIRPDKPGIPDAQEIARRVCHCATDNSIVRTEALNRAGASVGDLVSVSRKPYAVLKNVFTLIGLPLMAAIAGGLLGSRMGSAGMGIAVLAGALLGIMLGLWSYRRGSAENMPVIDAVIQSRDKFTDIFPGQAGAGGKEPSGCQVGCDRCNPWLS